MMSLSLSDVAVVLVSHGDRGGEACNAALLAHAQALTDTGAFGRVSAGTLKSADLTLEDALGVAEAAGVARLCVYPLFMADGYFTGKVLPERIAAAGLGQRCTILQPLGLDPQLPALMMQHAVGVAQAAALNPAHTRLLIAGHGSKFSKASLRATERVACNLRRLQRFAWVETAYLEEAPLLAPQLLSGDLATIVVGFFSGDGLHAAEDVPGAIANAGADAHYAGPIGRHPGIVPLIEAAVHAAVKGQSAA